MILSLIVAASENNVIGRGKDLPWSLPDDLKFYRQKTFKHPIIMGRRTHEAIGRVLPDRTNIVVTRQPDYKAEGCIVVTSLQEAMKKAGAAADADGQDEIFVIGGGGIFKEALSLADRMYITRVHANVEGDAFFPDFDETEWELKEAKKHEADDKHPYAFTFQTWEHR
ncbi:MAG TPA: dihydrofolate reductase [Candidatus Peribacteraceae bacterium]|nr:dihydrofolate reductase [Candidatus Peribacteraceae bacterium]